MNTFIMLALAAQLTQAPTPLKCGEYQHAVHIPAHCANTCSPDAFACASVCFVTAPEDRCADDMHVVSEKEWQELMTRLRSLETVDRLAGNGR